MRLTLVIVSAILNVAVGLAQTGAYEVVAVEDAGNLTGRVVFAGTPPAPEKLAVTTDNAACGEEKPSRAVLVGEDGGVEGALVFLKSVRRGKSWEAREHVLGQTDCRFEPHVLLLPEGADLHILNDDRIAHNVRSFGEDSVFNVGQPRFVEKLLIEDFTRQVSERNVIRVGCDIHPWMKAYIVVQKHPYYTLSDKNGAFRITDVPPGQYELRLWHETLGQREKKVTVRANEETAVMTFELGN